MLTYSHLFVNPDMQNAPYPVGSNLLQSEVSARDLAGEIIKAFGPTEFILVARGSSGLILSSLLSKYISVTEIVAIKKEGEWSHDSAPVPRQIVKGKVLVIDDHVDSGKTLNDIIKKWYASNNIPIDGICLAGRITLRYIEDFKVDTLICRRIMENSIW